MSATEQLEARIDALEARALKLEHDVSELPVVALLATIDRQSQALAELAELVRELADNVDRGIKGSKVKGRLTRLRHRLGGATLPE